MGSLLLKSVSTTSHDGGNRAAFLEKRIARMEFVLLVSSNPRATSSSYMLARLGRYKAELNTIASEPLSSGKVFF